MSHQQNPRKGTPKGFNSTFFAAFIILGIVQIIFLNLGFNFPLQVISIILNLIGIFFTIPRSIASQFPSIRSVFNRIPRTVNIIVPIVLLLLLGISLVANYMFIFHQGFTGVEAQPHATPTTTSTTCPYLTRREFADNLQNIQMNVVVPKGCYMLLSIYSGYYIAPDNINITQGSLLAFQGPISISAFLSGGGGGFAGFSDESSAKAFYCYALHSNNVYSITKTPHSLDFAPQC